MTVVRAWLWGVVVVAVVVVSGCTTLRRAMLQDELDEIGPVPEDQYSLEIVRCDLNTERLTGGFTDVEPGEMVMIEARITNLSDRTRRFQMRPYVRPLGRDAEFERRPFLPTPPLDPGESWTDSTEAWRLEGEDSGYECKYEVWDSAVDVYDPPEQPDE